MYVDGTAFLFTKANHMLAVYKIYHALPIVTNLLWTAGRVKILPLHFFKLYLL